MELKGKKIAFLGDSITEGTGVQDCANNRYDNILKRECQLAKVFNYGIGGTRLAHQRMPSASPRHDLCFCGRAFDITQEADIIVVYGGVNDYIHGDAPIGAFGDTTPATFYGAVNYLMNFMKTRYEGKILVFMNPARVCYGDITCEKPSPRPIKQPDALPLPGYIKIIQKTAVLYDIPVLDLYEKLPIDPRIPEHKEKYTADGLHFNDDGHYLIAKCLQEFLEAL
ncbi:MAG: SGNH/GDSL hydrolase family protein [Oscillospiraceae bacterium]|nr:SGNH/GDSL hydrolase family protein [Oscillospiraceae bacterium]